MKDASDLRTKAKEQRRARRGTNAAYKDPDRVNFKNSKDMAKHEANESEDENRVEHQAFQATKKSNPY